MSDGKAKVKAFYDALDQPATKDVASLLTAALAPTWRSHASETDPGKDRDAFIAQVQMFGKAFTSLEWRVVEVIPAFDAGKVVVRSQITATPAGDFRGVAHNGGSFTTMTIDIHTIEDGQLVAAHHVEDWAGAVEQLKAAAS
ncbi:MAG TPA: ester cyclase [Phycicoccus elongatus]|nr:ester cyclase [Phycicoccus elongatus]